MKVSSILVTNVIIELQRRGIFSNILSLNMKVSSILVISVNIKLQHRVVLRHIFSLNMKVSSILVISVIIKLQHREVFRFTWQESTVTIFWSVTTVIFRQSGDQAITVTRNLMPRQFNFFVHINKDTKNNSRFTQWVKSDIEYLLNSSFLSIKYQIQFHSCRCSWALFYPIFFHSLSSFVQ